MRVWFLLTLPQMSAMRAVVPPTLHSATSLCTAAWMISSSILLKACLMASWSLLSSEAGALLALNTAGSLQCTDTPSDGKADISSLDIVMRQIY